MIDSILTSVKSYLGIQKEYKHFDEQIIMAINTAFVALNQFGVGTSEPFVISDDRDTWDEFIEPDLIESVKLYVSLKVRLLFDPPQSSYLVNGIQDQLSEIEFRMMVQAEKDLLPEYDMSEIYS